METVGREGKGREGEWRRGKWRRNRRARKGNGRIHHAMTNIKTLQLLWSVSRNYNIKWENGDFISKDHNLDWSV
jgi:hypothetical protein